MLVRAGLDKVAVGRLQIGREQVIAAQTAAMREVPEPPPSIRPATPVVEIYLVARQRIGNLPMEQG